MVPAPTCGRSLGPGPARPRLAHGEQSSSSDSARAVERFADDIRVAGMARSSITLFETVSQQAATSLGLEARTDLPSRGRHHLSGLTGQDFSPVETA